MTVIASIGFASFVLLLLFREREARREREAWESERAKLLDRIQHPEVRQVEADIEYEEHVPPKDSAELAQVGQIVPEFVQVGGE